MLDVVVLVTTNAAQDILLREVLLIYEIGSVILLLLIILTILLVVEAVLHSEVIVVLHVLIIQVGCCGINQHVFNIFRFFIFVAFKLLEVYLTLLIYFSAILVHCEVASREEINETALMVEQLLKVRSEVLNFV